MLKHWLCVFSASMVLLSGCDGRKKLVRSEVDAAQKAPASIEEVFKGKTAGGKAVRAYKICLQAPQGEHLLLVLGDVNVPVSMSTAVAVNIGDKAQTSPYLSAGNGMVLVAKIDGTSLEPLSDAQEAPDAVPAPAVAPTAGKPVFPMAKFTQKVSGSVLQWPELDKL